MSCADEETGGYDASWIDVKHHCSMGYYNQLLEIAKKGGAYAEGGHWRPWRLFEAYPDYSQPWETLSYQDIEEEFQDSHDPLGQYFKHLLHRYEGEVAEAWGQWYWDESPLPTARRLWHPQYAKNASQRRLLDKAWRSSAGQSAIGDSQLLETVGDTTILCAEPTGGHWRRYGAAIILGELFQK